MNYDTTESNLLSTMQFSLLIEPSVFDDDRIIGGDEFNALTELIAKANTDYTYVLATAKESADAAQASENNAKNSETHAAASAGNAANSASIATEKAAEAADSADSSAGSANDAAQMAASAKASADLAQSHAAEAASLTHGDTGTREGEDNDNAQYYYLQSRNISESLAGALRPMGTVAFEDLPPLSSAIEGDMYNISDEFITTSDFKEGDGHVIPAGANVYKTSDGYWDILAGTPVTGIKGESETVYRRGNVNITPANIGALASDGDSQNNIVSFISGDSATANVWTNVPILTSGENHNSIFRKVSTMFKNIRYIYKMLGATDISTIGGGTVTGAIDALYNSSATQVGNLSIATSALTYSIRSYYYNPVTHEVTIVILCDGNRGMDDAIAVMQMESLRPHSTWTGLCWVMIEEGNELHVGYSRIDADGKIYQRITNNTIKRCAIYIKYVI